MENFLFLFFFNSKTQSKWYLWCMLCIIMMIFFAIPLLITAYMAMLKGHMFAFALCRSASVTNLSLDRSGSMVPSYDSSVSPQSSRAGSKTDHSEEERKILLVHIPPPKHHTKTHLYNVFLCRVFPWGFITWQTFIDLNFSVFIYLTRILTVFLYMYHFHIICRIHLS